MRVVIAGAGNVGSTVAESLLKEGNNISLIDNDEDRLKLVNQQLDVLTIKGNAVNLDVLKKAGVENSDLFIAVTNSDEVNLLSCLSAGLLNAKKKIARVREHDYSFFETNGFGIDKIINTEEQTAIEISRLLRNVLAIEIESFANELVQLVEMRVDENSKLLNKTIKELNIPKGLFIICSIEKEEEIIIPTMDTKFELGDRFFMVGKTEDMEKISEFLGWKGEKIKNIFIMGGGIVAELLVKNLEKYNTNVKIIEKDKQRCEVLSEKLPGYLILNGDGTDMNQLKNAGIDEMDAFVAITGDDEDNLLTALLAKQLGVKKTIAKIKRIGLIELTELIGIDSAVNTKQITINNVLRFLRREEVVSTSLLEGGKAEVMEIIAKENSNIIKNPLSELNLKDALIGAILRNGEVLIPSGETVIEPNDRVVVFTLKKYISKIQKYFKSK